MTKKNRILVALDESESARKALHMAVQIAKATGAHIDCIGIIDLSALDVYDGFYLSDTQMEAVEAQVRTKVLETAVEVCRAAGVEVRTQVLVGRASKLLLEECTKDDVLFIAVGRTGKNVVSRMILGSVSHKLAAAAACPVMVAP